MQQKRRKILIGVILTVILIAAACFGIYISDYYHADKMALEAAEQSTDYVEIHRIDNNIAFVPENPAAGLIFYPGAKVQFESYAPLMQKCAESGVLCILVHMPGNLAVLDKNAADGIREEYPEIKNWYMAGHSLGGAMAASYIAGHQDEYRGLILLAAYSASDLSKSKLSVLSVYGSEDKVLDKNSYEENRVNLPDDLAEVRIEGGCHAYFGCYGFQEGDGTPTISNEEQMEQTVNAIKDWSGQN